MHSSTLSASALLLQLASAAKLSTLTARISNLGSIGTTTLIEPVPLPTKRPAVLDMTTTLSLTVELKSATNTISGVTFTEMSEWTHTIEGSTSTLPTTTVDEVDTTTVGLKTSYKGLPLNPLYPTAFATDLLFTDGFEDVFSAKTPVATTPTVKATLLPTRTGETTTVIELTRPPTTTASVIDAVAAFTTASFPSSLDDLFDDFLDDEDFDSITSDVAAHLPTAAASAGSAWQALASDYPPSSFQEFIDDLLEDVLDDEDFLAPLETPSSVTRLSFTSTAIKTISTKGTVTIQHEAMITPPPTPITMDAAYLSSRSAILSHMSAASALADDDDDTDFTFGSYLDVEWALWHAQAAARTLRLMEEASVSLKISALSAGNKAATPTWNSYLETAMTQPTLTLTTTVTVSPTPAALQTRQVRDSAAINSSAGPDASMMAWIAQLPPPLRALFDDDSVNKLIIFHRGDLDIEYNTGLKAKRSVATLDERQSPDTPSRQSADTPARQVYKDGKSTIIVDDGNIKVQINKWGAQHQPLAA